MLFFKSNPPKPPASYNRTVVFEAEPLCLTNAIFARTLNGAMAAAVIVSDGGFDRITVGAGNQDSYYYYNKFFTPNPFVVHKKIKVNAVGAAPILGCRLINLAVGTYINFANPVGHAYINLATGAATASFTSHTVTSYNGFTTPIAAGEILDLYFFNTTNLTTVLRIVRNGITTPEISEVTLTWTVSGSAANNAFYYAGILADGDYTILQDEYYTTGKFRPTIAFCGDSIITGAAVSYANTLAQLMQAKSNYSVQMSASGGLMLAGIRVSLADILKLQPQFILLSNTIDAVFNGYVNPASPNHAAWKAAFDNCVNSIKQSGSRVIFFNGRSTIVTEANTILMRDYWAANFPNDLYFETPAAQCSYDSTGFHYSATANNFFSASLVALLATNGAT